jgi:hypothetical protein
MRSRPAVGRPQMGQISELLGIFVSTLGVDPETPVSRL